MLPVEAAVGLVQLCRYSLIVKRRRDRAKFYDENLSRREGWVFPPLVEGATYSHYAIRVPNRESIIKEYVQKKIHLGSLIQYSIPSLLEYSSEHTIQKNSEIASKSMINFIV